MKTSYTNKGALTAQESSGNPVGSIFNESMNLLIKILTKLGLLTKDLDYHVVRATMVIIYFSFGYQKWFPYEAQTLVPFISNGPFDFLDVPGFRPPRLQLVSRSFGVVVRCTDFPGLLE